MATTEHTRTSRGTSTRVLRRTVAGRAPSPPRPLDDAASQAGPDAVAPPDVAPPGATATILTTLNCGVWPAIVILAAVALIVPFLAGLIVAGLAGALLLLPYLLFRHWHSRRADERGT
jgi:hypothetical protein